MRIFGRVVEAGNEDKAEGQRGTFWPMRYVHNNRIGIRVGTE